jgi:hypothetical protein
MAHLTKRMRLAFGAVAILAACGGGIGTGAGTATAQATQTANPPASATHDDMAGMDMSGSRGDSNGASGDAAKAANDGMSGDDMGDMSAHMHMTDLRPPNAADQKRAAEIVAELKPAIEKYKDYHVALDDGYRIFLPRIEQHIYHFTNYASARESRFQFDPAKPTSLLYRKTADGGYELVGAMYTAPKNDTEEELNARVPLSVARWHKHTNICLPTIHSSLASLEQHEFRSITTEQACDAANGRWYPEVLNWMVHVYPYESDPAKVWAH